MILAIMIETWPMFPNQNTMKTNYNIQILPAYHEDEFIRLLVGNHGPSKIDGKKHIFVWDQENGNFKSTSVYQWKTNHSYDDNNEQ